jgi:hypothetical protein
MGAEVGLCTSSWERLKPCCVQGKRRDASVSQARRRLLGRIGRGGRESLGWGLPAPHWQGTVGTELS